MKSVSILVAFLASLAWAAPDCHFDYLSPNSDAWLHTIVRDPAKPLLDAAYPQRLHDSVRLHFRDWFENPGNGTPFLELLRQQHITLVSGIARNETYGGASRRDRNAGDS